MQTQPQTAARILVADDHPVFRAGMATIIEATRELSCIAQVEGVEQAVAAWRDDPPDLGVFDLRMADGDAVSAITRIRQFDGAARILVISTFDNDEEIYRVIKSGARGYLLKDDKPDTIVTAIRTVLRGQTYLAPHLVSKLASRVGEEELSEREIQILVLVAKGYKNARVAKTLNITESTIKFHLNNVYSKLGVSSRTSAVAIAARRGIISLE